MSTLALNSLYSLVCPQVHLLPALVSQRLKCKYIPQSFALNVIFRKCYNTKYLYLKSNKSSKMMRNMTTMSYKMAHKIP